ncbi:unnamed protein product [Anisakis simplex]|uniref:Fibroblast growth factor receptor-like 1 (inferred by orthology to a human protein) n=1 Tax=Anisakis simplex TaxID=6269 RepID=A0A0M3JTF9_ANISI|nr:unnamed protein product [Anisakis simplex]
MISAPPEFSDGVQTRFRVPIGTKQFRLICPVKTLDSSLVMIQWKKDDEQLSFDFNNRYKLSRGDRELKIRNPQIPDSGTYQCQAINGFGHRELDFIVHVYDPLNDKKYLLDEMITLADRSSPPKWLNESEMRNSMLAPLRLPIGGRLQLKCPASGNPLPHIIWLRNDKPIERDEITFEHSSALLTLNNLKISDSGEYICRVENEHGLVEATFRVRVGDFFNSAVGNDDENRLLLHTPSDDPASIRRADANATLIHANDMHLLLIEETQTNTQLNEGIYANRLVIPNANIQHAGTYICVVTNADGDIVYRSAHLNIITGNESSFQISSIYFYAGVPITALIVCAIGYAIYFLYRTQQNTAMKDCISGHSSNTINIRQASTALVGTINNNTKSSLNNNCSNMNDNENITINNKNGIQSTVNTNQKIRSLRPPPPNMPPPQAPAPLSPYTALPQQPHQQQHSQVNLATSPRYPLLVGQDFIGAHSAHHRPFLNVSTPIERDSRFRKANQYQRHPTLHYRTYADDESSNFYEASSPQPPYCWSSEQKVAGAAAGAQFTSATDMMLHCNFDADPIQYRLQSYAYASNNSNNNTARFDHHFSEQQLPFITHNVQRR